jgi:putative ABC transport system ATP-binding protein
MLESRRRQRVGSPRPSGPGNGARHHVNDTPVHRLTEGQLAVWRGQTIGIVFQFFQLLPTLSLLENIMLPMDFAGRYPSLERHRRAMELLAQVDMAEHADKFPRRCPVGSSSVWRSQGRWPTILSSSSPTSRLET